MKEIKINKKGTVIIIRIIRVIKKKENIKAIEARPKKKYKVTRDNFSFWFGFFV